MDKEQLLNICRPQKLCMNCNAAIHSIERHPSILKASKKVFERLDFCPDCWQQMKDEVYASFWITHRVIKEKKVKLSRKQKNNALRILFESLWDRRENEDVGPHLYFLAHLLMRWGGLRWKENIRDELGNEIVVFEDPITNERIETPAIDTDDPRMMLVQQEIDNFLNQFVPEDYEDQKE